jgi:hypothetical protein
MQRDTSISDELRRAGVAASTIREALGPWIVSETERIIKALAVCPPSHVDLIAIAADAKALHKVKSQLEQAMQRGGVGED